MQRRWFVSSGPDSRHLVDCEMFATLREAKAAYAESKCKAKKLFSLDFALWENGTNKRIIAEVIH